MHKQNRGLLSFGFILSLFFATNGIHSLMMAFNKSSLIIETRSWFKQRMIAVLLTLIIAFSVIVCITAMFVGELALNYIDMRLNLKDGLMVYCY